MKSWCYVSTLQKCINSKKSKKYAIKTEKNKNKAERKRIYLSKIQIEKATIIFHKQDSVIPLKRLIFLYFG